MDAVESTCLKPMIDVTQGWFPASKSSISAPTGLTTCKTAAAASLRELQRQRENVLFPA